MNKKLMSKLKEFFSLLGDVIKARSDDRLRLRFDQIKIRFYMIDDIT